MGRGSSAISAPAIPQYPCHAQTQMEGAEVDGGVPGVHSTDRRGPTLLGGPAGPPLVTVAPNFLDPGFSHLGVSLAFLHRALVFQTGSHCVLFSHLLLEDQPLDYLTSVLSCYVSKELLLFLLSPSFSFNSLFPSSFCSFSSPPFSLSSHFQGRSQVSQRP